MERQPRQVECNNQCDNHRTDPRFPDGSPMNMFRRNQIVFQSTAAPLDDRKAFRDNQLSVLGEVQHANRRAGRAIWTALGLMTIWTSSNVAAGVYFAPMLQKRIETHWIAVDRVNGYVQEIDGIENIPMQFSEANERNAIRAYVEYYYDYTWETNRKHEDRIRVMSSADQLSRYKKWADENPNSPKQKLAHHGSSEVDRILYYKQPNGDAQTHEYIVKFTYREIANGRAEPGWRNFTGHIQFQWQPKLVTDADWAANNPGGFYVTYFIANEDPK
jgi:type IV secretory pathway component VirB8